jgi:uncharacterized membrane protein HdeD (DUF308 family)
MAKKAKIQTPSRKESNPKDAQVEMPFGRMNYILLIAGIVVIGFGFFLMSLDNFVDATKFSISLYIAPIVVVAGFVEIIFAIMYNPDKGKSPGDLQA